jgi:membrane protein required for colicin V production
MPTILDLVLIITMLISGLLALVRGFMREILAIAAWAAAAAVTVYVFTAYPRVAVPAQEWIKNEMASKAAVALCIFIATLVIVSIFTVKMSDSVLDSRIGALDRTLGFLFGLARGYLIIVVAFQFVIFWVSEKQRPDSITKAKSLVVLTESGEWLKSMLPDNLLESLENRMSKKKLDDDQSEADPTSANDGYTRSQRDGMKKLIEKPAAK